ncbi:MAG: hypothetical protein ACUVXA_19860 [Candidatus Jordarchaeum sp.]|uniref:hypothetical protein n=1 Tax=Candidatus Jordarchaeum sp. TaxID=2823881 RepID=UPI00404A2FF0
MSHLLRIIEKNEELFRSIALKFLKERREQVLKELQEVDQKLRKLEQKHGLFEEYAENLPESYESHETWFAWKALVETKKELERELTDIEKATREVTRKE